MALWAIAAWIRWRERWWALPFFALTGCLILLAHLFTFGVYALVLSTYEFGVLRYGLRQVRRELINALHLAVPALLYVIAMPHELGGMVYYRPAPLKVDQLRSVIGFYNPKFDALSLVILVLVATYGARHLRLARELVIPLVALALAYVVLPHSMGHGDFVDYRMPSVFALFLCSSLTWREGYQGGARKCL